MHFRTSFWETFAGHGLRQLRGWCIRQQLPLLYERSVRLQSGAPQDRRGLFSIPLAALQPTATEPVSQQLKDMSCPAELLAQVHQLLPAAAVVHFGFESASDTLIGKCYLELPEAGEPQSAAGKVQFLGFKWSMTDHSVAVVSRYHTVSGLAWTAIGQQMTSTLNPVLQNPFGRLLADFAPADVAVADEYRLLKVVEDGNQRLSFDLNVYACRRTVAQIQTSLRDVAKALATETNSFHSWLQHREQAVVGHLAAGCSRHGAPFVTIYHSADLATLTSEP